MIFELADIKNQQNKLLKSLFHTRVYVIRNSEAQFIGLKINLILLHVILQTLAIL